jgi:hypothetical protein
VSLGRGAAVINKIDKYFHIAVQYGENISQPRKISEKTSTLSHPFSEFILITVHSILPAGVQALLRI